MEQGQAASGERHAQIIADGAEGHGLAGDKSLLDIVQVGDHSVTGGSLDAVILGQTGTDAFALPEIRLVSPAVLPGVQRADCSSCLIHVDDAVHLPGQSDGGNIRGTVQDFFQCGLGFAKNPGDILDSLPWAGGGEEGPVVQGAGFFNGKISGIHHNDADGGGSDVDADTFHKCDHSSISAGKGAVSDDGTCCFQSRICSRRSLACRSSP